MVRLKVCCIQSPEEMWLAIQYGASALGLVSEMPSGPGPIAEDRIAELARVVPPGIATFLLTSKTTATEIIEQHGCCRTSVIQIVDELKDGTHAEIRTALPGIKLVQVVHVRGRESVDEALSVANEVDALLLDSGNPSLAVKELGGTGRVHDWLLSRVIRERAGVPVYLAGGLTPENVADAIRTVGPFAVDVCSGVRTDDMLDEAKLKRFAQSLNCSA